MSLGKALLWRRGVDALRGGVRGADEPLGAGGWKRLDGSRSPGWALRASDAHNDVAVCGLRVLRVGEVRGRGVGVESVDSRWKREDVWHFLFACK